MEIPPEGPAFENLLGYLREARGFDFTGYKRASLTRRIRRRMQDVGAEDYASYQELLEAQPEEFTALFNTILINSTGFFRDRETWDYLSDKVLPKLLDGRGDDEAVRVWSAGCSSGEEVYSLAVLLCDAMGEDRFRQTVKIYGTDADMDAISLARRARYSAKEMFAAFDTEQIERYFERDQNDLVFRPDLRRPVIFGRHDLLRDPPISRVDLLVCRNTLMYFNSESQRSILANFHFALREGGFLFLGKSEALVTRTNLFMAEALRHHIFRKDKQDRGKLVSAAQANREPRHHADAGLAGVVFDYGPQAQLVVDRTGLLVMANRRARSLFSMGLNHIGRPFHELPVSFRPADLRSRVQQVIEDHRVQVIPNVEYDLPSGGQEQLEIHVQALLVDNAALGAEVTFSEVGRYKELQDELERSQGQLEEAYEELQSAVEELETTNEELQSTNEELETTNEELHSTNEELETMNEELQSTNEELETINNALRERTSELDELSLFLQSILSSLRWGVAVLSSDMTVRVWNSEAEELWGLRADEVHGQHFLNLDIGLPVMSLRQGIRACVAGRSVGERIELDAVNRRGRPVHCSVSIYPLRGSVTQGGAIVLMEARAVATDGASEEVGASPEIDAEPESSPDDDGHGTSDEKAGARGHSSAVQPAEPPADSD